MATGLANRVACVIEDLDLVLAADIARRCGVSRTTVMRWRLTDREAAAPVLSHPHVTIGGREYWSWRLLCRLDPDRFPGQRDMAAP